MSLCLLSHRSLLKGDDEPNTLPYANASVCSMGADVRQKVSTPAMTDLFPDLLDLFEQSVNAGEQRKIRIAMVGIGLR